VAARLLARRPLTTTELEARLVAMGYQARTASGVVARAPELRWLDDETLAHDRARSLRARGAGAAADRGRSGSAGLPVALIGAAIDASRDGRSETEWAEQALAEAGTRRALVRGAGVAAASCSGVSGGRGRPVVDVGWSRVDALVGSLDDVWVVSQFSSGRRWPGVPGIPRQDGARPQERARPVRRVWSFVGMKEKTAKALREDRPADVGDVDVDGDRCRQQVDP
jgi:hypothetical protein